MAKIKKTNAMRILDSKKIDYEIYTYDSKGFLDGISVAEAIGKSKEEVFKTLVTQGVSKEYYVFIIPVAEELNLKKASKVSGEKKIEMIPVKDITKITGYIKGGCSPIGMKKQFKTFIHESCTDKDEVIFSAGKIGMQVQVGVTALLKDLGIQAVDLIK